MSRLFKESLNNINVQEQDGSLIIRYRSLISDTDKKYKVDIVEEFGCLDESNAKLQLYLTYIDNFLGTQEAKDSESFEIALIKLSNNKTLMSQEIYWGLNEFMKYYYISDRKIVRTLKQIFKPSNSIQITSLGSSGKGKSTFLTMIMDEKYSKVFTKIASKFGNKTSFPISLMLNQETAKLHVRLKSMESLAEQLLNTIAQIARHIIENNIDISKLHFKEKFEILKSSYKSVDINDQFRIILLFIRQEEALEGLFEIVSDFILQLGEVPTEKEEIEKCVVMYRTKVVNNHFEVYKKVEELAIKIVKDTLGKLLIKCSIESPIISKDSIEEVMGKIISIELDKNIDNEGFREFLDSALASREILKKEEAPAISPLITEMLIVSPMRKEVLCNLSFYKDTCLWIQDSVGHSSEAQKNMLYNNLDSDYYVFFTKLTDSGSIITTETMSMMKTAFQLQIQKKMIFLYTCSDVKLQSIADDDGYYIDDVRYIIDTLYINDEIQSVEPKLKEITSYNVDFEEAKKILCESSFFINLLESDKVSSFTCTHAELISKYDCISKALNVLYKRMPVYRAKNIILKPHNADNNYFNPLIRPMIETILNSIRNSNLITRLKQDIDIARWNTMEAGCDRAYRKKDDFVGVSVPINPKECILDILFTQNPKFIDALHVDMNRFVKENYTLEHNTEISDQKCYSYISNAVLNTLKNNLVEAVVTVIFGFNNKMFNEALYPSQLDYYQTVTSYRRVKYKEAIISTLNDTEGFVTVWEHFIYKSIQDVVKYYQ